jgi:iron complex outermembrane receptor protein
MGENMLGAMPFAQKAAFAVLATVSYIALTLPASAQSAPAAPSASNSTLPPVVIQSPAKRQAKPQQARRNATAPRRAAARRARNPNARGTQPANSAAAPAPETAYSHVEGYVATRSATGTKTDTPLIETPQSISVVTRDQIEAQNADSAKQALRYTAGVAGENRGNFGGFDIMYGRGFILDQYLDGMRLPGSTAIFAPQPEMFGIERVELLRGPASVLFGQGSLGGLVNMVSKRPSEISSNEVVLQGGSYDRIQGGFDSTGKLDKNGDLLYRITGFAKDADNQVNFAKEQRYYISPALTWRPDKDTTWTVKFDYQKDPSVGYYNFVPYNGSLGPNPAVGKLPTSFYSGDPNFNTLRREQISGTSLFEHRFDNGFTVRQNLRYMQVNGSFDQVLPLGLDANFGGTSYDTLYRYTQATRERIDALTTDTQGEYKFETGLLSHRVLFGVDTQNVLYKQRQAQSSAEGCILIGPPAGCSTVGAPDLSLSNPIYGYPIVSPFNDPDLVGNIASRQTLQQTGVYAQDQIKFGRLTAIGGLRYDAANARTDSADYLFGGGGVVNQHDHATTGRVGLIYNFDNGVAPYVTYATSFAPNVGTDPTLAPLVPTTGELYEAGIKYQPTWFKGFFQASVFDLTQQNVLSIAPFPSNLRTQIGEVRSQGFEIEGKASLTDNLDIIASFTHVNPKVTRSLDTDLGKRPTWIPNDVGAIWADYTFRGGSLNGFGMAMGVRYTGQTWGDKENLTLNVPSYTLFDAALHYELVNLDPRLKGAKLSINATNLFDKVYVSQCTVQFDNNCVYGLRRQVIATLRYRW